MATNSRKPPLKLTRRGKVAVGLLLAGLAVAFLVLVPAEPLWY